MSKTAAVTVDLKLNTKPFDAQRNKVKNAFKDFRGAAGNMPPGLSAAAGAVQGIARNIGSRAFTLGFYTVAAATGVATKSFLDYDDALTRGMAKFGGGGAIKRGSQAWSEVENIVKQVGATTEHTMTQSAEGVKAFAEAGWEYNDVVSLLPGTANLATAAGVEIGQAAEWSMSNMNQFRLKTDDTAQSLKNMNMVNDVVATTVNSAALGFEDFADAMRYAGTIAGGSDQEFKDAAAGIGLLAQAGIKGTTAGTTFRSMMFGLETPTDKGRKQIEKLGVSVVDAAGKVRPVVDIFRDMNIAMKDMTSVDKLQTIKDIFVKWAAPGAKFMTDINPDKMMDFVDKIGRYEGAVDRIAEEVRKSVLNQLKVAWSAFDSLTISLADEFRPEIESVIATVREWATNGNATEIANKIREIAKQIRPLWGVLKKFGAVVYKIAIYYLPPLTSAFSSLLGFLENNMWILWSLYGLFFTWKTVTFVSSIYDMVEAFGGAAIAAMDYLAILHTRAVPLLLSFAGKVAAAAAWIWASALGPILIVLGLVGAAVAICAYNWQSWMDNLNEAGWHKLAAYMKEVQLMIEYWAELFGMKEKSNGVTFISRPLAGTAGAPMSPPPAGAAGGTGAANPYDKGFRYDYRNSQPNMGYGDNFGAAARGINSGEAKPDDFSTESFTRILEAFAKQNAAPVIQVNAAPGVKTTVEQSSGSVNALINFSSSRGAGQN